MRAVRYILTALGGFIFIIFTPLVSLVFNKMSLFGMGIGIILILAGLFLPTLTAKAKKHRVITLIISVLLALAILWAVFCTVMLTVSALKATGDSDTVIVLGCQLNGTKPSRMLCQRLELAYEYLSAHPESKAIMSGGKGPDEVIPEAVAMQAYLVERGIDPSRLFIEDQSHNTQQNMLYCAEIIKKEGLSPHVVVITQAFHQYRAFVYAEKAGLTAYPLNCHTDITTLPTFWLRELFGIVKMYLVLTAASCRCHTAL